MAGAWQQHPLYGGPSYDYSYGKDLDPTELQYFQELELQQSLQQRQLSGYLGQSNYNVDQSYTQSFLQRYNKGGLLSRGFSAIPEDGETMVSHYDDEPQQSYQRRAEIALQSWKVEIVSQTGPDLALSSTASSIDLKDFLSKRGGKQLEGLHKLAAQGDRAGIMSYMKQHGPSAPLDELDTNGCTPLMYASIADSKLAIEMLLNFSTKREKTDPEGRTAVHYAAFFGKHRALKFLIDTAADWTPSDAYGRTPLHWSCFSKSTRAMAVLLKHAQVVMGNINPLDHEGMTPLHCAAHFCRPRHIALLYEAECDFTVVDCEEKTPLHWTASNPDPSCIQVLVDLYPSLLNKQDINGSTILHCVTQRGATHLVAALLGVEGIDIDVKDNAERTALHWACAGDHGELVRLLLRAYALDSCIDSNGLTALHCAVQASSVSCVKAFVSMKDMTHLPDNQGRTPLMEAATNNMPEIVELLLRNQLIVKSIDHKDLNGVSSLHLAAECGAVECVTTLLSNGSNPNLTDPAHRTPIFLAAQYGHGDCIQALISKGGEMNLYNEEWQTALHVAVMYNQMESVKVLAMNGADLNVKDGSGNTSLHIAAYGGNTTMLALLLKQSANPNLQDDNGVSPVHLAAMEGYTECIEILIQHRAYLNFVDFSENGYTAVDYARLYGHTACVETLSEGGGMATEEIRSIAALTIQTAYRGYRSRVLYSELTLKHQAAIILTKHVRGFLQRRKFAKVKRQQYAAIKIQAYIRGHLQRLRFQIIIAQYREEKRNWKLIENFDRLVQYGHEKAILKTFDTPKELLPEKMGDRKVEGVLERERKLRLEASMQMRLLYQEKQRKWYEFREAERQRRIIKADKEEMNRLNKIIADSKARREYHTSKFHHTLTVRSHYHAAITIQRAFKKMKLTRAINAKQSQMMENIRKRTRERAAQVIQMAWRRYQKHKIYRATNFVSIITGPVIDLGQRKGGPSGIHSYERAISITGSPKRKMHQTLPSGFQVFRPKTRDLLIGLNPVPANRSNFLASDHEKRTIGIRSVRKVGGTISPPFKVKNGSSDGSKKQKGMLSKKDQVTLPKLFTMENYGGQHSTCNSKAESIHLPEIASGP